MSAIETRHELSYQERLDALRETKLRQTQEKIDYIGAMDHDDWAVVLPPPDRRKVAHVLSSSGVPITDVLLDGIAIESNHWVLVRDPLGEYETRSLLCTDPTVEAAQVATWFVRRWPVETTFEEARRHLGVETQRQWSDPAIARTTPLLMGLFSWITVLAHALHSAGRPVTARPSAWYAKSLPTFSDTKWSIEMI